MNFLQHNQQLNIFNISPQHWSLSPLRLAPVELELSKSLPASLCSDQPNHLKETKGCTITVPALSAQGPGNFLRALDKKYSAADIQGTNDSSALVGSSYVASVNAASEKFRTWVAWEASSFLLKVTKAYLDKTQI